MSFGGSVKIEALSKAISLEHRRVLNLSLEVEMAPVFQQSEKIVREKTDSISPTKRVSDPDKRRMLLDANVAVQPLECIRTQVQRDLSIAEAIVSADLSIADAIVSADTGEKPSPSSHQDGQRDPLGSRLKKPNKNVQETRPCSRPNVETKF